MHIKTRSWTLPFVVGGLFLTAACDDTNSDSNNGVPTTGGSAGSDGSDTDGSGTRGDGSSAGTSGDSDGGSDPTTGDNGSGTAGDATTGDDSGTGGSTSGGGAQEGYTFDGDAEGWSVTYEENIPGTSEDMRVSAISHEGADGQPNPGSAKLDAAFDDASTEEMDPLQKVHSSAFPEVPLDLTGASVTGQIKLVSGGSGDPSCPLGAKLFLKSGETFVWADGGFVNLEEGVWIEASIDASVPMFSEPGFDAADIREIGIEVFASDAAGCTASAAVLLFDTVVY